MPKKMAATACVGQRAGELNGGRLQELEILLNPFGAVGPDHRHKVRQRRGFRFPNRLRECQTGVCTENLIRVDDVMESPKLAE